MVMMIIEHLSVRIEYDTPIMNHMITYLALLSIFSSCYFLWAYIAREDIDIKILIIHEFLWIHIFLQGAFSLEFGPNLDRHVFSVFVMVDNLKKFSSANRTPIFWFTAPIFDTGSAENMATWIQFSLGLNFDCVQTNWTFLLGSRFRRRWYLTQFKIYI